MKARSADQPLDPDKIDEFAHRLERARRSRRPTTRLTDEHPGLAESDAYAVADRGMKLRKDRGEKVVGAKLGFTSAAMQKAMGVTSPNFGWLTDRMIVSDGRLSLAELIHPKAEPEIAFALGEDLAGQAISAEHVLAATAYVMPVIEVVDSRYVGFRFRALDNTADNSSAGKVFLGNRVTRPTFDLSRVGVVVTLNGRLLYTSAGSAALGHPAASVAWLVRRLAGSGRGLKAGHLVISGGLTGPIELEPGADVVLEIDRMGSACMQVQD